MSVDDSREFTIPWEGESWWDRFWRELKEWWDKLETWQKATVIVTGGAGGVAGGYAATRKPKAKKP